MTHRILVVDDEPDILELTRFALTREGYQVETASTGDEGLARMRRARPDLVVLDLMLPDVSGTEICRTMRGSSDLSSLKRVEKFKMENSRNTEQGLTNAEFRIFTSLFVNQGSLFEILLVSNSCR